MSESPLPRRLWWLGRFTADCMGCGGNSGVQERVVLKITVCDWESRMEGWSCHVEKVAEKRKWWRAYPGDTVRGTWNIWSYSRNASRPTLAQNRKIGAILFLQAIATCRQARIQKVSHLPSSIGTRLIQGEAISLIPNSCCDSKVLGNIRFRYFYIYTFIILYHRRWS